MFVSESQISQPRSALVFLLMSESAAQGSALNQVLYVEFSVVYSARGLVSSAAARLHWKPALSEVLSDINTGRGPWSGTEATVPTS